MVKTDYFCSVLRFLKSSQERGLIIDPSSFCYGIPLMYSGGYAYIDSAYPRQPGDAARLRLRSVLLTDPDRPLCLRFYVNMFGPGIGSLSLLQVGLNSSAAPSILWEMVRPASSPRDLWYEAQVTVSAQLPANLIFEATVGETDRGDIALGEGSDFRKDCI